MPLPTVNDTDPPLPNDAVPVPIARKPLLPEIVVPVPIYTVPLLPLLATPVDNTANPLTPAPPALAVCRSKLPLEATLL